MLCPVRLQDLVGPFQLRMGLWVWKTYSRRNGKGLGRGAKMGIRFRDPTHFFIIGKKKLVN
jgi:hypothetical protein